MSSAQNDTFSPHNMTVLGGLLILAIFLGEMVVGGKDEAMVDTMASVDNIAMRLTPVVTLDDIRANMTMASAAADEANKTPDQLYQSACLACHSTGAAGAPKLGDAAAWAARAGKGVEALISSAINGIGAMPARGGSQYSDEQIGAAVEYILGKSQ